MPVQSNPVQVFENIWNMTPGMSNSYLIICDNSALLIDTGTGRDDLMEQIAKLTSKPVSLVTTHAHGDHTGGHHLFDTFLIGENDIRFLDAGLKSKAVSYESSGDAIDFGGLTAEFIHTPGHTPGSYSVYIPSKNLLFTGDMICNGTIFMIEGMCDYNDFIKSMDIIASYKNASLLTCHGTPNVLPANHALKQKEAAKSYLSGKLKESKSTNGFEGTVYCNEDGLGFFKP